MPIKLRLFPVSAAALRKKWAEVNVSAEMALRGLKVVEMAGLAPSPFAGMILAGERGDTQALTRKVGGVTRIFNILI